MLSKSYNKDWISEKQPKVLLIGHDPRLRRSYTIAEFAFFADYYFRNEPNSNSEKQKYGLAKTVFDQILYLTNNKFKPEEICITNLCNEALPKSLKGKTVLIPNEKAINGLKNIVSILSNYPSIQFLFPMSLQVNYWLQKLVFYKSNNEFLSFSEPKVIGVTNIPPYYEPMKSGTFKLVCGHIYQSLLSDQKVIPILHPKNYPLNDKFIKIMAKVMRN